MVSKKYSYVLTQTAESDIDEGTKPLVVGRHCDVEDILLNDVGAALGYVAARFMNMDRRLAGNRRAVH